MEDVFKTFCRIGAVASAKEDPDPQMDNANFVKFCKAMKLLDKKTTETDANIVFAMCKK